jgi:hypothetical protein
VRRSQCCREGVRTVFTPLGATCARVFRARTCVASGAEGTHTSVERRHSSKFSASYSCSLLSLPSVLCPRHFAKRLRSPCFSCGWARCWKLLETSGNFGFLGLTGLVGSKWLWRYRLRSRPFECYTVASGWIRVGGACVREGHLIGERCDDAAPQQPSDARLMCVQFQPLDDSWRPARNTKPLPEPTAASTACRTQYV